MLAARIIVWILWALMLIGWPFKLLILVLNDSEPTDPVPLTDPIVTVLMSASVVVIGLTFLIRWFFLRWLIHPRRLKPGGSGAAVLYVLVGFTIFSLTQSVEIYGLVLFFQDYSFPKYFIFSIPSFLIMFVHLPYWLAPRDSVEPA